MVQNSFTVEHGFRKRGVELLDPRIPNRDLGINDRIDEEAIAVGGTLDGPRRPYKPTRIFRHDIEKNVGVDQYRRHSVIAGQRHHCIRAHRDIAASPQMSDKSGAATIVLAGFGANDAHDLAVELEFHLRLRQQTRPLADFSRNGHLWSAVA